MDQEPYICPNCNQPIYDEDALLCHFCGESLNRAGSGLLSNMRYSKSKQVWIIVILLVLVAFLMLYIF